MTDIKGVELRGQMKASGQDIRLHSEGGGVAFIEFDEGASANWLMLRKESRGKAIRFLAQITEEEAFGRKPKE